MFAIWNTAIDRLNTSDIVEDNEALVRLGYPASNRRNWVFRFKCKGPGNFTEAVTESSGALGV